MGDEDAKRASEKLRDLLLRELLDATAPAATVRELLAATTFAAPSLAFAAPAGWNLSVGAVVRLAPGVDETNGLRPGELATVTHVNSLNCRGNILLTRRRDGEVLYPYFKRDLQHGLDGWLPLHAAAALNLAVEVVAVLIDANHDAASKRDAGGFLPLELALQNNASDEVVLRLSDATRVRLFKATRAAVGADERTALHLVVGASRNIAVIRKVFEADPSAMRAVDADGKMPHQLLQSAHGSELIAFFVSQLKLRDLALKDLLQRCASPQLFAELLDRGIDSELLLLAAADLRELEGAKLCFKKGASGVTPMPGKGRVARDVGAMSPDSDVATYFRGLGVFYGRYLIRAGHPAYRSTTALVLFAEDLCAGADFERIFDDADANHDGVLQESELNTAAAALGVNRNALAYDDIVSKKVFVALCKRLLGGGAKGSRSVVLKFMQDKSHWKREMARAGDSPSDAGTKTILDAQFIVQSLPGLEDTDAVAAAVDVGEGGLAALKELYPVGRHVIVMEAGDRSLHEIFEQERPGLNGTRTLFQQVLRAVAYLHKEGFVHGDIKMRNVVRLKHDGRLRLIDLGCAARTQKRGGPVSVLGAKFSSATLPPEMLCALDGAQMVKFEEYWAPERGSSSDLWAKVAPKRVSNERHYVVKTYRVSSDDDAPVNAGPLPYTLVKATVAVDIWALGVLLFHLCVGEPLVQSTRDDDLKTGDAMEFIVNWDDATALDEALSEVKDAAARDLCSKLLRADPGERRRVDLEKLLTTHPFFVPESGNAEVLLVAKRIEKKLDEVGDQAKEINERAKKIHGLALKTNDELSRGLAALKHLIGPAGEITVPTVFVIKPTAVQSIEKTVALFGCLSEARDMIQDPVGALKAALGKDDYELWLCCEVCYMPQTGETGKWPCSMSVSSPGTLEFAARVLPLARAVLQAAVVVNGISNIGRLLGFPIPEIPTVEAGALGFLERETSVAEFQALEQRLHLAAGAVELAGADATTDADPAAVVGPALREFKRFLDEHDPDHGWCGLSPVFLDEGAKVFCCGACCKALKERPTATFAELREAVEYPCGPPVAAAAPQTLNTPPAEEQPVATPADADAAAVAADAGAPAADRAFEIKALLARVAQLEAQPAPVLPAPEYPWINSLWYS